jgi:LAO/AO transport system kinase
VPEPESQVLAQEVLAGDRRAVARAITLVESTRADHRPEADRLLGELLSSTGRAVRVGISGPPGVGKSTFIEALGLHVVGRGHRLAVLAVDPSSRRSGGSILGDKTRMADLARHPDAFIRPSPGGSQLGGVARHTREAVLVCEAAGFDVVFVETIGVGQSEVAVADMVDLFLLLVAPGGGDELQGIKRGIMELADIVVVNKADGDLAPAAGRTAADYANAVHLLRPKWASWSTAVLTCSALEAHGIPEVWEGVERFAHTVEASGELAALRAEQARSWMWSELQDGMLDQLRADTAVQHLLDEVEADVVGGRTTPGAAARLVLARFRGVADSDLR